MMFLHLFFCDFYGFLKGPQFSQAINVVLGELESKILKVVSLLIGDDSIIKISTLLMVSGLLDKGLKFVHNKNDNKIKVNNPN